MFNYQRLLFHPIGATVVTLIVFSFVASSYSHVIPAYGLPKIQRNAMVALQSNLRIKRTVADGMLDPYSVLGFLSFATFLFSVLYSNNKMKPSKGGSGGGSGPTGPPMFNAADMTKFKDFSPLVPLLIAAIKDSKPPVPKTEKVEEYVDYDESYEAVEANEKHKDKKQST